MTSQKRFVSWAAVSSLPQAKKISLDDQRKVNLEHIAKHDGVLVEELVVPGESRNIILFEDAAKRIDAYADLKRLIDERAFDVLIYLDRSRLGRKASLSMAVVELCHEAGIVTYETENPPSDLEKPSETFDDLLLGAIKSVGAQREVSKLKQRHRMGMIDRVNRGEFPGHIPWGWAVRYDEAGNQRVVIDESAAALIREIFELYLHGGLGMEAVAAELNRRQLRTVHGAIWQLAHIQGLFRLVWRYAGYSEINIGGERIRAPGKWEPIIAEATAYAIEAERKSRTKRAKSVATPYLLSRLVICTEHNSYMAVNTMHDEDGHVAQQYLRCKHCQRKYYIRFERVIEAIRGTITFLSEQSNRTALLQALALGESSVHVEIEVIEKQIERAQAAILRADDAYTAGVMDTERYRRQVSRQNEAIHSAQVELDKLRQTAADNRYAQNRQERLETIALHGLSILESENIAAANAWLRQYFVVYVTGPTITEVRPL